MKYAWTYIVHNEYLLRLAETGIIGFLLFYFLVLVVIIRLWRTARSPDPWIFVVSGGLFAALIGSLPHRMVSVYHYLSFFLQWCVVLALTQVMTVFERERVTEIEAGPSSGEEKEAA
jgi:O-antigen ligase